MRRTRLLGIAGLVLALLPTAPLPGQDADTGGPGKASTATVEGALTDLGIRYQKQTITDKSGAPVQYLYRFDRDGRPVSLLYLGDALMLQHQRPRIPAEKVSDWNVRSIFSRLYTQKEVSFLEFALDCKAGASAATVKQFLRRFDDELKSFNSFLSDRARLPVHFLDKEQRRIEITFPAGKKDWRTAWKVEWDIEKRPVPARLRWTGTLVPENVYFRIKQAWFRPGPTEDWIQVLNDARVSELFVPYNDGKIRWYDVMDHGRLWQIKNEEAEAGLSGQVLGKERCVVGELRDRGIAYKNVDGQARRAQEFVLWANLNAGNYNYLIQYGFQDSGTITFQVGATGQNLHLGKAKHEYPRMGHMHNTCWRLGIRLGPQGKSKNANTAYLVRHLENAKGKGQADQVPALFNDGNEGFADWKAEEFTRLRVENPEVTVGKNRQPIAYELVPLRQGTSRHHGARVERGKRRSEEFTLHDFWVTRADSDLFHYPDLPEHFAKLKAEGREPGKLTGTDLVLWYTSSVLHDPRAEDGLNPVHGGRPTGPALTAWGGFELRPRHLFTRTPLFPPPKQ